MMRKDVKLGFAIGGVLLAVLVVYVLVGTGGDRKSVADSGAVTVTEDPANSAGNKNLPDNKSDALGGDSGKSIAGGTNAINTMPASGSTGLASNSGTNGTNAAPHDPNKDLWGAALNDGKLMMTETPDTTAAARPGGTSDIPGGGTPHNPSNKPAPAPREASETANAPTPNAPTPNAATPATMPAHAETARHENDVVTGGPGAANTPAELGASSAAVNPGSPAAATPAISESSPSAPIARTHVIQKNETLASIAEMAYGNRNLYPAIMRANPNLDPKKMRPGTTIVLPPISDVRPDTVNAADHTANATPASHSAASVDSRSEYRIAPGDTLERIAMKLYGKRDMIDKLYELNKDKIGPDRDKLRLGMVLKLPEPPQSASR